MAKVTICMLYVLLTMSLNLTRQSQRGRLWPESVVPYPESLAEKRMFSFEKEIEQT